MAMTGLAEISTPNPTVIYDFKSLQGTFVQSHQVTEDKGSEKPFFLRQSH